LRGTRACLGRLGLVAVRVGAFATTAGTGGEPYAGKTVRIPRRLPAGRRLDTYSRLLARHLPQHIPGKPAVVVENMPGAASLIAANYAYRAARPDALTIVAFHGNQILGQVLGQLGVEFDARRFVWLRAQLREVTVCATPGAGASPASDPGRRRRLPSGSGAPGAAGRRTTPPGCFR
jgi:tripartite-type tricarboxylate transporter receptor subunit TctC